MKPKTDPFSIGCFIFLAVFLSFMTVYAASLWDIILNPYITFIVFALALYQLWEKDEER